MNRASVCLFPTLSVSELSRGRDLEIQEQFRYLASWDYNSWSFDLEIWSGFLSNADCNLQWTNDISWELDQKFKKNIKDNISLKYNTYSSFMYLELLLIFLFCVLVFYCTMSKSKNWDKEVSSFKSRIPSDLAFRKKNVITLITFNTSLDILKLPPLVCYALSYLVKIHFVLNSSVLNLKITAKLVTIPWNLKVPAIKIIKTFHTNSDKKWKISGQLVWIWENQNAFYISGFELLWL